MLVALLYLQWPEFALYVSMTRGVKNLCVSAGIASRELLGRAKACVVHSKAVRSALNYVNECTVC